MPPRFAYWTILIDDAPTAFRAKDQVDLLPTLQQLRRTNPNVVLKWFAQGRLWDSPEHAREARKPPPKPQEKRGRDWRPGGQHRDPRVRTKPGRPGGPWKPDAPGRPGEHGRGPAAAGRPRPPGGPHVKKPWDKPRPQSADRDRSPRDTRHGDGRSHHGQGQAQRGAHGGARRPFSHEGRAPGGRDDRRPQKAWPKRDSDRRPGPPSKPEGGKKPFTKPHWQARDPRDQKGRPDQRGQSNWRPKPRPHGPPHKPWSADAPRRESGRPLPKPPKPPDETSGEQKPDSKKR